MENILVSDSTKVLSKGSSIEGESISIHIPLNKKISSCTMCTSYISVEQALLNHSKELANRTLNDVADQASKIWEEVLSRIEVKTFTKKQMMTFYSCLYRCFLYPHKCHEYNQLGEPIHFNPFDGKVHDGVRYTDTGFWDTYRTLFPLFSIIAKEEYKDMLIGFNNEYKESGWLPRWSSMIETGCMRST